MNELEKAGQNVRKIYQRRLPSDTSKDYYFIHRDTGVTQPIIVEYGFLDSTGDDVEQLKNNWQKYADAVVKAVSEYIGINQTGDYIVKSGDSLWSIAKKYNTNVNEIKTLNNLSTNMLKIGQLLKLPSTDNKAENTYIVKSGDTLYGIANKYNVTVSELKNINNLTTNALSVGQSLVIPKTEVIVEEPTTANYILYTVKQGDNLYAIGRTYGLSQETIMKYNNLTSNLLSIGQVLKIPMSDTNITYTVKSGDNLYSIARNFNTTVDSIKQKNNLTTNLLNIGQKLVI